MVDLFRSKTGGTVHAPGCPTPGRRVAWIWAQSMSLAEVRTHLWQTGLWAYVSPCGVCAPFAELNAESSDPS